MANSILELRRDELMAFDASAIARSAEVGTQLSFSSAAERTRDLQGILAEIDMEALRYVPQEMQSELVETIKEYVFSRA